MRSVMQIRHRLRGQFAAGPRQIRCRHDVSTGVTRWGLRTPSRRHWAPRGDAKCVSGDGQSFASCSLAITTSAIAAKSCKGLPGRLGVDHDSRIGRLGARGCQRLRNRNLQLGQQYHRSWRQPRVPSRMCVAQRHQHVFSALASTVIAVPLGPGTVTVLSSPTALARRWARSWVAAGSASHRRTVPARLRALRPLLAPFPPGVRVPATPQARSPGRDVPRRQVHVHAATTHRRYRPTLVSLVTMLAVG